MKEESRLVIKETRVYLSLIINAYYSTEAHVVSGKSSLFPVKRL